MTIIMETIRACRQFPIYQAILVEQKRLKQTVIVLSHCKLNHLPIIAYHLIVKPVRRACARGWIFGQNARARAARAKCSLAGLTNHLIIYQLFHIENLIPIKSALQLPSGNQERL